VFTRARFSVVMLILLVVATACAQPTAAPSPTQAPPAAAPTAAPAPTTAPAAAPTKGSDTSSLPTVAPQPTARPAAAGTKPSDTVYVGLNIDANTLDPHFVASTQEYGILKNTFEQLVAINYEKGGFDGLLAESWTTPDPNTWEFKLRKGITFQDGEPFNAAAVKYTFDRILDPALKTTARRVPDAINFDKIEVVDDYTVRILTKKPAPGMLTQLWILQIVAPKYYQTTPAGDLARLPIGTGPYKVTEWVKDDHITFEAWDGYWGPKPAINTIIYRPIPDTQTRISELETGGIDIALSLSPDDIATVAGFPNAEVRQVQSGRRVFLALNTAIAPLDKVEVRQALNYAINWDAINKNILMNMAGPRLATYVMPPDQNPALTAYPFDLDKAKQLLTQAGLPNGFDVTLEVPTGRYIKGAEMAQAIAADWAKIGIKAKILNEEWSVFSAKTTAKKMEGIYLYGLASAWNPYDDLNDLNPANVFAAYNWTDQEYLDLLSQYPTADAATRKQISDKAQVILHDRGPQLFLWRQIQLYGVNKGLVWNPRPDDYIIGADMKGLTR
jgi:peptide/nickel transport system substrate-binding protein